jgi:hypothetical protein
MVRRIVDQGNHLDVASAADADQQALRKQVFRQDGFAKTPVHLDGNDSVWDHLTKRLGTRPVCNFFNRFEVVVSSKPNVHRSNIHDEPPGRVAGR